MAPRANWKGYLRLSLVSCPIALYPAASLREKTVSIASIGRPETGSSNRTWIPRPARSSRARTLREAMRSAKANISWSSYRPAGVQQTASENKGGWYWRRRGDTAFRVLDPEFFSLRVGRAFPLGYTVGAAMAVDRASCMTDRCPSQCGEPMWL